MAYKMKTSVSGLCSPLQQSYEVGSKRHSRKLKKQSKTRGQLKDAGFEQMSNHRSVRGTMFMGSGPRHYQAEDGLYKQHKPMSSKKSTRKLKKYDKTAKQLDEFY